MNTLPPVVVGESVTVAPPARSSVSDASSYSVALPDVTGVPTSAVTVAVSVPSPLSVVTNAGSGGTAMPEPAGTPARATFVVVTMSYFAYTG